MQPRAKGKNCGDALKFDGVDLVIMNVLREVSKSSCQPSMQYLNLSFELHILPVNYPHNESNLGLGFCFELWVVSTK